MRNPDRIHKMVAMLEQVWNQVPDWRLGQLICNLGRELHQFDPFYVEDEKMEQLLRSHIRDAEEK